MNQHSSVGVSRAALIHTHSGSPPGVRETLLRNLVANSSTAWLGQRVCVRGESLSALGACWRWAGSTYGNQPWGKSQTASPQILHSVFSSVSALVQVPPGPSKPRHLFPRTRSLGPSLGACVCVFLCVTLTSFSGVPCFIIILITVVLSFMLPLTFIFGLVMLLICL